MIVVDVLSYFVVGMSNQEILEVFFYLEEEDIFVVLAYVVQECV